MAVMNLAKAGNARMASGDVLEIELAPRNVRRLAGDHRGVRIKCTGGMLWITQDGDLDDYYLAAAEQFTITRPGTIVLQGMPR